MHNTNSPINFPKKKPNCFTKPETRYLTPPPSSSGGESPHRRCLLYNIETFRKTLKSERQSRSSSISPQKKSPLVERLKSFNFSKWEQEAKREISIKKIHKKLVDSQRIPVSLLVKRTKDMNRRLHKDYLKNKEELHKKVHKTISKSVKSHRQPSHSLNYKQKYLT